MIVPAQQQFAQAARDARARMGASINSGPPAVALVRLPKAEEAKISEEPKQDFPAYRMVRWYACQSLEFSRALVFDFAREVTGYTIPALIGRRRTPEVALSRHFAMWMFLEMRRDSLTEAGNAFNKHHSTLIHARDKIRDMIQHGGLPEEWHRVARYVLARNLRNLTEPTP